LLNSSSDRTPAAGFDVESRRAFFDDPASAVTLLVTFAALFEDVIGCLLPSVTYRVSAEPVVSQRQGRFKSSGDSSFSVDVGHQGCAQQQRGYWIKNSLRVAMVDWSAVAG
jgi:hypothetical protein